MAQDTAALPAFRTAHFEARPDSAALGLYYLVRRGEETPIGEQLFEAAFAQTAVVLAEAGFNAGVTQMQKEWLRKIIFKGSQVRNQLRKPLAAPEEIPYVPNKARSEGRAFN